MKNRILCITSNFPRWRGDSTTPFVLNLVKDLVDLGWHIDVLAPHATGTASMEVMDGVHVRRFQYLWPERWETICYGGGALINLRKDKKNYVKLPFLVGAQWLNVMKDLWIQNYDILHSHWILPQGFTGIMTAKLLNIPHVVTVHGGDIFGLRSKLLNTIKRSVLFNADAVTVNSSVTKRKTLEIANGVKDIRLIPMGIAVYPDKPSTEVKNIRHRYLKGEGPLLVYVGRIVDEKGVADLIRAVAILSKEYPDVAAMIIGEGQDRKAMESLSDSLKLSERIFFLGWIDQESVGAYMAAADVFVGPSRQAADGWVEAQGLTFIEAMVARTPVIATRVGGIIDSVLHEETGLLVNERCPVEIAGAITRLMSDSSLKDKLVSNGYALASSRYSRQECAKSFDVLFKSLLPNNRFDHG